MADNKDESTKSRKSANFLENVSFNNDANELLQILLKKRNIPQSHRIFGSLSPKDKPIKFPTIYIKNKVHYENQRNGDDVVIEGQNENCNSNLLANKSKNFPLKSLEKQKNHHRAQFHPTASSTPQLNVPKSPSSLSTISLISSDGKQQKTTKNIRNIDNRQNCEDLGVLPIDDGDNNEEERDDNDNNDQLLSDEQIEEDEEERTLQEEEKEIESENEGHSQHTIVTTTINKNNQSKNVTNSHSKKQDKELNTNLTKIKQNKQMNELLSYSVNLDETFEDIVQNNHNSNNKHERRSNSGNLIEQQQQKQNITRNKTVTNNISKNKTLHNQTSKNYNGISQKNISQNVNNNEESKRMQSKENSLNNNIYDKNQKTIQNTSKTPQIITNNEIENHDEIEDENENENQSIMETNYMPAIEEIIPEEQEHLTFNDNNEKYNSNRNSHIENTIISREQTNKELIELLLSQPFNEGDIADDMDQNSQPKWLTDVIEQKNKRIGNTETRKRKVGSRKIKKQNVDTVKENFLEITKRFTQKKSNNHKLSNTRRTLYTKGQSEEPEDIEDVDNRTKNSEKVNKTSKSVLKPMENTINSRESQSSVQQNTNNKNLKLHQGNQKHNLCPTEVIIKLKKLKNFQLNSENDKKSDKKEEKSSINSKNDNQESIKLISQSGKNTTKKHREDCSHTEPIEIAEKVHDVDIISQHEIPTKQKETKKREGKKRAVKDKKLSKPDCTSSRTANKEDENVVGLRRSTRPRCHRKAYWLNDKIDIEETEIWQQFQLIRKKKEISFKTNEKEKNKSKYKANKKQIESEPMENIEEEIITENLNKKSKNHICEVIIEENENESIDLISDDERIKETTSNVVKKTRTNVKENSKSRSYRRIIVDEIDEENEITDSNENIEANEVTNTRNIQKSGSNTISMNNNENQKSCHQGHDNDDQRLFSQNKANLDDKKTFIRKSRRIQNKINGKKETCIDSGNASDDNNDNTTLEKSNESRRSKAGKRKSPTDDDGMNKHKFVHQNHSEEMRHDNWLQKFSNCEWNPNDLCIINALLKDDLNLGITGLKDLVFKKKDSVEYAFYRANYGFLRVHSNSEKKICRQKHHDKLNFLVLFGSPIFYIEEKILHCNGGDLVTVLKGQNYKIQNNTEFEILLLFSC